MSTSSPPYTPTVAPQHTPTRTLPCAGERPSLYSNIASAAESGWDFSSRWLHPSGPFAWQLPSMRTMRIVPVDLNAILCQNEASLAYLFTAVGESPSVSGPCLTPTARIWG